MYCTFCKALSRPHLYFNIVIVKVLVAHKTMHVYGRILVKLFCSVVCLFRTPTYWRSPMGEIFKLFWQFQYKLLLSLLWGYWLFFFYSIWHTSVLVSATFNWINLIVEGANCVWCIWCDLVEMCCYDARAIVYLFVKRKAKCNEY